MTIYAHAVFPDAAPSAASRAPLSSPCCRQAHAMTRIPHPSLARAARLCAAALLLAPLAAPAQTPPRALIPVMDAATVTRRCEEELAAVRSLLQAMEKQRGSAGVLAAFNRLALRGDGFSGPVDLLANVAPEQATRDAAQACVEKFAPLSSEIFQSAALYRRVQALKPADAIDGSYRQALLDNFKQSGASLPPARRARAKAIQEELTVLGLAYQKAVNEDKTTVVLAPEDAEGLPADWLAARKRDDQGRLVLGLDYPTVLPFLQNGVREDARRRLWTAFSNRGGEANVQRLDQAVKLRHELAGLHGLPDFATYQLRQRMAGTPQAVQAFLGQVRGAVQQGEAAELADLRAEKAALLGKPVAEVTVNRWDSAFLQERLKRSRYAIDQEKLRAYFPTEQSLAFTMKVAERLYGIEFVRADVPVWHPDVRYYDVFERGADGRRGAFVGGAYLDLFPRDGKYGHAAAWPALAASGLAGRRPSSALVTNFNRQGLDHNELETLLHEFGHVLHGVLSQARYADQAGTSVKRDFVEAPSQMFEEWARRPETLALFAEVCPDCPRLSPEQLKQLDQARTFGRGLQYARQWALASFDMALHTGAPKPAMATWAAAERQTVLGHVEGTMLPANFGHLMGGYEAGYYGYMWSEVMGLDMLSAFKGRLLDPQVGRRYRELILSRGGEVPPQRMVEQFLGRKPNADAFFAEITGKR